MTETNISYDTMRKRTYITITAEEWNELDRTIKAAGFKNRTEYFNATALAVLYGESMDAWCINIRNLVTFKRETEQTFFHLLDEYAFPVIAMQGSRIACTALTNDLQQMMFESCRIVPTRDEIERLIDIYEQINKVKLGKYRTNLHAEAYQETKYAE